MGNMLDYADWRRWLLLLFQLFFFSHFANLRHQIGTKRQTCKWFALRDFNRICWDGNGKKKNNFQYFVTYVRSTRVTHILCLFIAVSQSVCVYVVVGEGVFTCAIQPQFPQKTSSFHFDQCVTISILHTFPFSNVSIWVFFPFILVFARLFTNDTRAHFRQFKFNPI